MSDSIKVTMGDSSLNMNKQIKMVALAREKFRERYKKAPKYGARAPGRVNLIGDHVDYCEGFVLPLALQHSTIVIGDFNGTNKIRLTSMAKDEEDLEVEFETHSAENPLKPGNRNDWANYVKGVIAYFPGEVKGFDAVIISNVPVGAGLSSSAALEVSMFTFLEAMTKIKVEPKQKALLCQKAEHEFAGMPCGIMDQLIAVMGKLDNALLIDCKTLRTKQIPIVLPNEVLLVTNSNVKHRLTGSEYPERRAQCETAAALLDKTSLREVYSDDLKDLRCSNADDAVIKRAQHVVSEIARTEEVGHCLRVGDLERAGELFYESHESLKNFMEVSCPEIDKIIDIHKGVKGVLGARMTGGGFGGCVVAIVHKDAAVKLVDEVQEHFPGFPEFFVCFPSNGASTINVNNGLSAVDFTFNFKM